MNEKLESSATIAEMAAIWLARHDRGLTPQEEREFAEWFRSDQRHTEEWTSMTETWETLNSVEDLPDLAAEAAALEQRTRLAPRSSRIVRWVLPVLAVAAALVLGIFIGRKSPEASDSALSPAVVLLAAEAKRIELSDGSMLETRGDSDVEYDYSGPERHLRLIRGEAFFTVAHDATRPFILEAGGVAVRAVGTAFNVRRDSDRVDIMVTEGSVRLANSPTATTDTAPLLAAGAAARISQTANDLVFETREVSPAELDTALAWRSSLLEFSRASLNEVLGAFRQHSPNEVRLADPALGKRRISGTFRADNIEGFLRLAESIHGLRVERTPDGSIILHGTPGS